MMILDTDAVIKRILIVVFSVVISIAFGIAIWYNSNLKMEFDEGKTETNQLREETSRLGASNDELRHVTELAFREVRNSLLSEKEETLKLDSSLKEQNQFTKQLQQEQERNKVETKQELNKLYERSTQLLELLKQKEIELKNETQKLKAEYERFKNETKIEHNNLQATNAAVIQNLKVKEQELDQIKQQLQKEVEWRTKYYPLSR